MHGGCNPHPLFANTICESSPVSYPYKCCSERESLFGFVLEKKWYSHTIVLEVSQSAKVLKVWGIKWALLKFLKLLFS